MSLPYDYDPTPVRTKKQPALKLGPIHGVLPFKGAREPLTRSFVAQRVSRTMATPATQWQKQLYHFDSAAEEAAALEMALSPEFHGLEVQLSGLPYDHPDRQTLKKDKPEHYFDLRVTFRDGYRRVVYVKSGKGLQRASTQREIDAIHAALTPDIADDMIVVNGDHFTRAYRDNLHRIYHLLQEPDDAADAHVEQVARNTGY